MAVDVFLKIADIPGESADSKHKGEIDVLSYSFGASQTGTMAYGGGGGAGKVVPGLQLHDENEQGHAEDHAGLRWWQAHQGRHSHLPQGWRQAAGVHDL